MKLVDLLLQKVPIKRKDLQLVGATSILIAAKFDVSLHSLHVYITCILVKVEVPSEFTYFTL